MSEIIITGEDKPEDEQPQEEQMEINFQATEEDEEPFVNVGDTPELVVVAKSVKLNQRTAKLARIVSAYRDESITDLLSDILEPILARLEQEEIVKQCEAMASQTGEPHDEHD
ncbi:MAG TPA: hypothetical protein VMV94_07015 [Phycisphaerae bacterium]|nr:hypothetical protein [Phycisphaerae bacterium]